MNPTIDYLRISLIDRCNFRCSYCMPEGADLTYLLSQEMLGDRELMGLLEQVFVPLGFTRFRLTGGEPLLRPGIVGIVEAIAQLPQTQDISLTTNGFLLKDLAQPLFDAGLTRVNISLDSLDPATFDAMVGNRGRSRWQQVWDGIQEAHRVGFDPLKLNVVVIPGVNDQEVLDLAALTIDRNWHVRFIEFMPIGNGDLFSDRGWIDSEMIRTQLRDRWGLAEGQVRGNGPADVFQIPGAKGTVGFISQMSDCFCDRCNRLRLSADGWLRPCLLNETGQLDLKALVRSGASPEQQRQAVADLLQLKAEINFKLRDSGQPEGSYRRTMSQIGG
jgi:GTP 3',8-cyclase